MVNIGLNFWTFISDNLGYVTMALLAIAAAYCVVKREFLKLVGIIVGGIVVFLFVFNPMGVKDFLLNIGNYVIGSGTAGLMGFPLM